MFAPLVSNSALLFDERSSMRYLVAFLVVAVLVRVGSAQEINFSRQIRPLLSDKCFACHGPDAKKREASFRLDQKESALGKAESGKHVIVPKDINASELIARITSSDGDLRMPPADTNKSLTKDEIELLKKWVAQGANWQEHWAFVAPVKAKAPKVSSANWAISPVDHFVLARLEAVNLKPGSAASKETLIRRVTFDLTGLPPTPEAVQAFLSDKSDVAYEKLIDGLLKSRAYGEHMARFWLDAARYGDTHGLHLDNYREMWPYRDWVVNAFNSNIGFDQFVTEQLAGDLLPNATQGQIVATGFNRCHVTTGEGGSIKEEVYVRNVVDRVVTTGTVFMGMTFECTRCHDHKYDPFTMKEFYSMFAYFNNLDAQPMDGNKKDHAPVLRYQSVEQRKEIADLGDKITTTRAAITQALAEYKFVEPPKPSPTKADAPTEFVWIEDAVPAGAGAQGGWTFVKSPKPVFSGKTSSTRTAVGLSQHFFEKAAKPLKVSARDVLFSYVYLDPKNPPKEIMLQWNSGKWSHRAYWGGNLIDWGKDKTAERKHHGDLPKAGEWVRLEIKVADVGLKPGAMINGWAFTQFDGTTYWDKSGIVSQSNQNRSYDSLIAWRADMQATKGAGLPNEIKAVALKSELSKSEQQTIRDYFIEHVLVASRAKFKPLQDEVAKNEAQIKKIESAAATTLIFKERKDLKAAFLLNRGEYDQKRNEVKRGTPAVLPPFPTDAPQNRLGLAKWLTTSSHPLTARVAVNRFWQQVFGIGLVKTAEDFGSQGEQPSHPDLLDWLSVTFMEEGWDVKKTMKRLVMSAAYRQSSRVSPELIDVDPENRLVSRGPRFRLDAEMLRDQALAYANLLNNKIGGPSVKPPQPDGLWFAVGYSGSNTVRFKSDQGAERVHRRSLYTFIKRTAPPPQMSTFDAPSRESCMVRRERTNTPLQALLLMNDPQFVECARALGERAMKEGGKTTADRANFMLQLCTARKPQPDEIKELVEVWSDVLKVYKLEVEGAKKLISIGESKADPSLDVSELAAWTISANIVLNMDEVLTKN
jgi:hypothetical protein